MVVRTIGLEPMFPGWNPDALPLNYVREFGRSAEAHEMAESTGIEPVRPEGLDALAPRCLTARPTLRISAYVFLRFLYIAAGERTRTRTSIAGLEGPSLSR